MLFWKKRNKSILTEEDLSELRNIERESYMDAARKIAKERGVIMARRELILKEKGGEY